MLAETVVLSIIIGLVFKGRLDDLSKLDLKYIYLPIVAFALEMAGSQMLKRQVEVFASNIDIATLIIEVLVYGLLIFFFFVNIEVRGMKLLLCGTMLNFLVIISNGGYMPVDPALGIEHGYTVSLTALRSGQIFAHNMITEDTTLRILSDWIKLPPPWPFPKTISPGDILMDLGVFLLIFKGMKAGHASENSL